VEIKSRRKNTKKKKTGTHSQATGDFRKGTSFSMTPLGALALSEGNPEKTKDWLRRKKGIKQ